MKRILITGATGFIGKVLTRHLSETDHQVKVLIHPSQKTPDLPRGVPVEAAVSSLKDQRGLRAAVVDTNTIIHLASQEAQGARGNLLEVDIQGTKSLVEVAEDEGVDRFIYLSHLGADRASAYPMMTAKAIAEDHIRKSRLDYTIFRCGLVFGPGDRFTVPLSNLMQRIPLVFPLPDEGETILQPLWVEDLAHVLLWTLDEAESHQQLYEIGGPEHLSFQEIVTILMRTLGINRSLFPVTTPLLRFSTIFADYLSIPIPTNVFWLDYLAANRTCSLDIIPRVFNLLPSRFEKRLDYLTFKQEEHV